MVDKLLQESCHVEHLISLRTVYVCGCDLCYILTYSMVQNLP